MSHLGHYPTSRRRSVMSVSVRRTDIGRMGCLVSCVPNCDIHLATKKQAQSRVSVEFSAAAPKSWRERSCQSKSVIGAAEVGREPSAECTAEHPGRATPGPAAHDMPFAVFSRPGRSVARCAKVVVVEAVLGPVITVAMNLIEPPRIRREGSNR
jgi:hypothetical protein